MQYGSLVNLLTADTTSTAPIVGMGATELCWSDRHAWTVVEVSASGKTCKVQRDIATRSDKNGMSESQSYDYAPDSSGEVIILRRNKRGQWVHKGTVFKMGQRTEYHDDSF